MNDLETTATLALHRLRVHNPGKLTDDEVIAAFVCRRELLTRILNDLEAETADSRGQHHLIVGQRGMGKTMLLMRLAAELRRTPLCERLLPLVFAEEQYTVDRLSKFWLNCLDSLADACERRGDDSRAEQIDATVRRLYRSGGPSAGRDREAADAALDALLAAASQCGRRLVLLVDNLQLVFERLDDSQQHALRELFMRPGGPVLVGASPQLPAETQDYGAPFYDHFKTHYLRPLTTEEMQQVLVSLSEAAGRPDIAGHVREHPQRLEVLRRLTGGNPRTAVLLFQLYAEEFSPSVFADLERLLDVVTPLYKARFEELSAQMQVVAGALADHWDPMTIRAMGRQTGLPATSISSQLDRLRKLGFVEEVEVFPASRAGYQIAERFFNIWFLMRQTSRRRRKQVHFLTRFLEAFYSPTQRAQMAQATEIDPQDAVSWNSSWNALPPPEQSKVPDSTLLHHALFAAYDANWGIATGHLAAALDRLQDGFPPGTVDDWMRASAVLLHLGYGAELLELLQSRGDDERLRPWYSAIDALVQGDRRYLNNVAVEVREPAEWYYDQMQRRREPRVPT